MAEQDMQNNITQKHDGQGAARNEAAISHMNNSQIAGQSGALNETGNEGKYLVYKVGGEYYGTTLEEIIEVIEPMATSRLPSSPSYCLGMMNLRGEVITVYDLRLRFGQKAERTPNAFMIVVSNSKEKSAFLVDEMVEVRGFLDSQVDRDVKLITNLPKESFVGVGKGGEHIVYLIKLAGLAAA